MAHEVDSDSGSGALAAGWLLVLVTAVGAGAGAWLGSLADVTVLGGLGGGALGVIAGFAIVWRTYVVPANEADAKRDYSNIRTVEDDDDDSW